MTDAIAYPLPPLRKPVRFDTGVVVWGLYRAVELALRGVIPDVHQRVCGRPPIVTSCCDGEHSAGSLHYEGRALDLRTRDVDSVKRSELAGELQQELGQDWDVVLESTHIHVEWDPETLERAA